jgi:hypothetical protein
MTVSYGKLFAGSAMSAAFWTELRIFNGCQQARSLIEHNCARTADAYRETPMWPGAILGRSRRSLPGRSDLETWFGLLTGQSVPVFVIYETRRDPLPDSPFCSRVVPEHRIFTCSWRAPGHFDAAALSKKHGWAQSQQHCGTWAASSLDLVPGRTMIRSARMLENRLKYNNPT